MKIYYHKQISSFIESTQKSTQSKIARAVLRLKEYGPDLGMPLSKKIDNQLWELRIRGKQEVRIFYCTYKDGIYLLHAFTKKTQKIPLKELALARKRL